MKTFEELGISPTPWTFYDEGTRNAEPTYTVRSPIRVISHGLFIEDASFISAAPDMYVALRELINAVLNGDPCHDAIQRGKAALAKASGEGEV